MVNMWFVASGREEGGGRREEEEEEGYPRNQFYRNPPNIWPGL